MRQERRNRIGFTLFFTLFLFANFVLTALIVAAISFIADRTGVIGGPEKFSYSFVVASVLLACVIVGTLVSLILGWIPLKMMKEIISSINQLADGDFSARLHIAHPPELRELTDSFNRMAEDLGGLELLRKDFINNFSHEFKTPIVSIRGFAEILKYNNDDLTPEERNEYLDIVISESGRLASLATNILNLSKVENQTIVSDKASFNLGEKVRRSVLMLEPRWEKKKLSVSAEIQDVDCIGNEELLDQVWLNLIDNAIKFTAKGGIIWVILREEAGNAIFIICDNGVGISPDSATHIFDRFYQADQSHAAEGNGLGLALVKKIVELHGGSITCSSNLGEGTEFTVRLPLKDS